MCYSSKSWSGPMQCSLHDTTWQCSWYVNEGDFWHLQWHLTSTYYILQTLHSQFQTKVFLLEHGTQEFSGQSPIHGLLNKPIKAAFPFDILVVERLICHSRPQKVTIRANLSFAFSSTLIQYLHVFYSKRGVGRW